MLSSRRVRVNSRYIYIHVIMDVINIHLRHAGLKNGDEVKVINLHNCPPANAMGMCYVEKAGTFIGMVCCNSLIPIKKWKEKNEDEKIEALKTNVV